MACPNRYQKSSLRAYNLVEQDFPSPSSIVFSTIRYKSGISIEFTENTSAIYLKKPGLYYITLDVGLTNETANTETMVQMYKDGAEVAGAVATATITATGDEIPTTISAVVPVEGSCPCAGGSVITFRVSGTTAAIVDANVNVIKLA